MKSPAAVRRRAKKALAEQGGTITSLAKQIGVTGAIHNCFSGLSNSTRTKQAIVNALRCNDLFPGVRITDKWMPFEAGMFVNWGTAEMTAQFLSEVGPAAVEIRKNLVRIVEDIEMLVSSRGSAASKPLSASEKAAQMKQASERVITFYDSEMEAEAIAEAEALADADKQFQGVEKPAKATINKPKAKGRSAAAPRR